MTLALTPSINPAAFQRSGVTDYANDPFKAPPSRDEFAGVFKAAVRDTTKGNTSAAREHAQDLVAMTFVQPLLAQLRNDVFGGGAFASGPVQDRLAPIAAAAIARNIVERSRLPLVDAVERTITNAPVNGAAS